MKHLKRLGLGILLVVAIIIICIGLAALDEYRARMYEIYWYEINWGMGICVFLIIAYFVGAYVMWEYEFKQSKNKENEQ